MKHYPIWMNIIFYQMIWFGGVLGRETYVPALFALIVLHLVLCKDRWLEILLMVACTIIGVAVDSALAMTGFYRFDPHPVLLPVPIWLVVIWFGFAATLRHGFSFFIARPVIGICVTAIAAPLTYLAAGRLGAVSFSLPALESGLIISVVWILMMSIFIPMTRFISGFSQIGQRKKPSNIRSL